MSFFDTDLACSPESVIINSASGYVDDEMPMEDDSNNTLTSISSTGETQRAVESLQNSSFMLDTPNSNNPDENNADDKAKVPSSSNPIQAPAAALGAASYYNYNAVHKSTPELLRQRALAIRQAQHTKKQ